MKFVGKFSVTEVNAALFLLPLCRVETAGRQRVWANWRSVLSFRRAQESNLGGRTSHVGLKKTQCYDFAKCQHEHEKPINGSNAAFVVLLLCRVETAGRH